MLKLQSLSLAGRTIAIMQEPQERKQAKKIQPYVTESVITVLVSPSIYIIVGFIGVKSHGNCQCYAVCFVCFLISGLVTW